MVKIAFYIRFKINTFIADSSLFIRVMKVNPVTGTFQDSGKSSLTLKSALALPNLTPYQPSGWDNKLAVSAGTIDISKNVILDKLK
jgi:hypothetical protein